jgi:SAM-dependent methyltransferase
MMRLSTSPVGIPLSGIDSVQSALSFRVYHDPGVVKAYGPWPYLSIMESMALLKYQPAFVGGDVLDLGVGTGRTTLFLEPLARRYEGLDFSPVMVDYVRRQMPRVSVHLGDIRDLSAFGNASFDFVFGPNNVISAVSHSDRLRTIAEAHRVLRGDGLFVFSSHNLGYRDAHAGPRLRLQRNPVSMARNVVAFGRSLVNDARIRHHRFVGEAYELINDEGHEFGLLHYYVRRAVADAQLQEAGFRLLDVIDPSGRFLAAAEPDDHAPFLLYVARKS